MPGGGNCAKASELQAAKTIAATASRDRRMASSDRASLTPDGHTGKSSRGVNRGAPARSDRRHHAGADALALERGHALVGELIGALVELVAIVALDPAPVDDVTGHGFVQRLPELDILYGLLVGGPPAVLLPAEDPLGEPVLDVDTVGVELDLAFARQRIERTDRGRELHAIVGGERFAAFQLLDGRAILQHRAPAARAGIAGARPVGVDDDLASHQATGLSSRGRLKTIASRCVPLAATEMSKRAAKASMISSTSVSGAEAPAVMPSFVTPSNNGQSISLARSTSMAFSQPARLATSTSRTELEELGEPTTIIASTSGATRFTAS